MNKFPYVNSGELGGGYFVTAHAPIDNRMVVEKKSDLYTIWDGYTNSNDKKSGTYQNMLVSVIEENQVYMLKSELGEDGKYKKCDYTKPESWKLVGNETIDDALGEIENGKQSALESIGTDKDAALSAIEGAKQDALESIQTFDPSSYVKKTGFNGGLTGDTITLSSGITAQTFNGYTISKSVPSNALFTDTKNTAGSSNNTSRMYLIGALAQTSAGTQTYSNSKCYVSGNMLYSNSQPVVTMDILSQFDTEIYNYVDNIVENGTVNNANKIGGQTIDEIVEQLQIKTPTINSGMTANIIGFNGGQTYMSDVIMSGNSISAPNGFYQESDERLKTFVSDVEVDLDKIAELPKKLFYWNGREDEGLQMGTSAQEVQKLYPEIVHEGKDGKLVIDYTKLAIVSLKAIDVLNMERKQMKSDIEQIKEKLGL